MKGRLVVLGEFRGREAAAIVQDGQVEDLIVAPADDAPPGVGAIFRGTVDRQMKGQGGAFVRLGPGLKGFLRETRGIAPGQTLLCQIASHAEPGKAPPVTLRLMFKSRYAIVTPDAPGLNVSRRIRESEDRARLEALAAEAMAGSEAGLILRSACAGADDAEVAADIADMRELSEAVLADSAGGPELLVDAPGPHESAWRDWGDPAPDEIDDTPGAFARHGVDEAVEKLLRAEVALPGGGSMVVEPTRALIAVDVNTGGDSSPAAGLKANIAAARELPRQLRLRGLAGQIAVDFAPMPKRDRAAVEQQLRAAFRADGIETSLAGWTPLGLFELQRKRERVPLAEILAGTTP